MKYENVEVLGSYSVREGGSINFSMGKNLELGTEINTYIHELFHMHLTNYSSLGFLLLLFEKECNLSLEYQDELHYNQIKELSTIIFNRTVDVQEVYANNQELLWLENNINSEFKEKSFKLKPKKYQEYCNKLNIITNDMRLNNEEKRYWIDRVCFYALNIQIFSDKFIEALKSRQKLSEYLSRNHPNKRLDEALVKYSKNEKFDGVVEIRIQDILSKIKKINIIKYFNEILSQLEPNATNFKIGDYLCENDIKKFIELNQKRMDERVKLFDFYNLDVIKVDDISNHLNFGIFAIKNYQSTINKENFYYITEALINLTPSYISEEVSYDFLNNPKIKVIGIPSQEFDIAKMKPNYIEVKDTPIVVLIDSYNTAKKILKVLLNGELYVGDLYEQTVKNFSTILFFRERTEPKIIYIFPTLKKMSIRLVKELGIEDILVYSKDTRFKKILSIFNCEVEMLKFIKWIFSFIMKSSCIFTSIGDPATKMSFNLTRSLFDDVMKIKIPNYYIHWAALPTKKTIGEPFYSLMEFENGENIGSFKATNQNTIIFFLNKNDAVNYRKKIFTTDSMAHKLEVVGIDRHYWNIIEKYILETGINICICTDVNNNIGKIMKLKEVDNIITQFSKV
ncbi:hypothetical protein [Bacillus subtilis]|uniref:hypothetical protein n=1 Tax=Bacillus subtilis TaxID=1423 RepID=UPI001367402E|nr:hypothetical protein [Bacillus subtilis]QHM11252.1 hypothetical protein C7M28_03056 [Bacillus subtilis]